MLRDERATKKMLCKTESSLVWMFDSYIIISVKTIDNILLTTLLTSNMTDQIQTMMKDWEHVA